MKTRLLPIVGLLLFATTTLQSQILNELRSYVDSSEVIFNNGRRMIYHSLASGDTMKAREVLTYLTDEASKKQCSAFSYNEELYINLLLSDWQGWLINAADYNSKIKEAACYKFTESYLDRLYNLTNRNIDRITSEIEIRNLSDEERELMQIYLYLIKNNQEDEKYSALYKAFAKKYPSSMYSGFLKGYLPKPKTKGSFAISVGPTVMLPTGALAQTFKPGVLFNYTMDVNLGKVYAGFHFDGGSMELKTPIYFINDLGQRVMDFDPGYKFSFVGGGVYMGYFLQRSNRFHLAPYMNIGGYTFESNLYPNNEPEYQIFDSFVFGPGIHTEFKLTEFNLDPYYGAVPGMESKSYISLKMDIGYDIVTKKVSSGFKGNLPYIRLGLVWGIGNF